jgi:hypothetical protein
MFSQVLFLPLEIVLPAPLELKEMKCRSASVSNVLAPTSVSCLSTEALPFPSSLLVRLESLTDPDFHPFNPLVSCPKSPSSVV